MRSNLPILIVASLLVSIIVACGDNNPDGSTTDASNGVPRVVSNLPAGNATGVPLNRSISATFSEAMNRATLTTGTFNLIAEVGSVSIPGIVISTSTTVAFVPTTQLAPSTSYIVTVTIGAKSATNVALAGSHTWGFRTGTTTTATGVPVNLGTAGTFVLLGKSGITNVPTSRITGNVGASPITSTAITGFPLTPDASNQFSTTPQVTGRIYAANYAPPTPV